ncbi:hypothetical protein PIB30_068429 [Stylosanthes scabra]|uniref:Cystatin domain-containing protein n=1 Tax=Stylosanthes scabra TaxID=79078 RepID=A0ABU6VN28_9FABA|nr:hypothetical protein [Stylosanthes scabra]
MELKNPLKDPDLSMSYDELKAKYEDSSGANFVFVELIIRANSQLIVGVMYYITFDAIDATANDSAAAAHTTFQAKVCHSLRSEPPIKVIMCQIKPN